MSIILNLETATKNCSVAIAKDGDLLASREFAAEGYSHAEKLHVFINEVLSESRIEFGEISAIAVSRGPGSYTGLRIGVSAAKGLCYALNIPLLAIDTLEILAAKVDIKDGLIVPMIDARRMEVYSAIFNASGDRVRDIEAEILTAESYSASSQKLYFIGDCQEKVNTLLKNDNFIFLPDIIYPSATGMVKLSAERFKNKQFEDVAYFEPFYLKDFIAGGKTL